MADEHDQVGDKPKRAKMKGWPKGLKPAEWRTLKAAGFTWEQVLEAHGLPGRVAEMLKWVADKLPKPPPNRADDWRTRHQLRDPFDYPVDMSPGSRFHIDRGDFPEGFDLNWKVAKIWQQPQSSEMARDRKMGWEPIRHGDFDGKFDGRWLPDDHKGEIEIDGLILCARPMTWSAKAKLMAEREARGQMNIKVRQIQAGEMPGVTMDTRHPTALASNRVGTEWERVEAPMTPQDK